MKKYNKILVAINLEDEDYSSTKFAARLSHMAESQEVHFFHVTDELDLPESLCSAVEGNTGCDAVTAAMKDRVEKNWDGFAKTRLSFDASDGDLLRDALAYIKKQEMDVVIVEKVCGGSKIPERLARKAPCSTLLVPPGSEPSFKNIFVAIDFSDHSREALTSALAYAKASGAGKLTCVHVYSVPMGYHRSGRTHEEFSDILKKNAAEEFDKLMKSLDPGDVKVELIVEMNERPYQGIIDIVRSNDADLLVVGSRGRSKTAAILLGSVTERLIEACNVPVLTIKKKGQGLSILEAMFDL